MKDLFTDEILPTSIKRKLLEKDIQGACVTWARKRGWWARKFSSPANRSVPDYIFGIFGCTVFVEFKAPGKKPTAAQLEEHKAMMDKGLTVHVIDDIDTFKSLFGQWEKEIADFRLVDKMMGDPTCSQSK